MKFKIVLTMLVFCAGHGGYSFAASISTHTFTGCNLPDTGQTGDFTATVGEDSDYMSSGNQPGYIMYNPVGTSSVTVDNRTGLMWVTNPVDAGMSGTFSWEGALTVCESLNYAGYPDWRLPNIRELESIASYGGGNPSINTSYFPNTLSAAYWSSTTVNSSATNAWYFDFANVVINYILKTTPLRLRCARGGPP